MTSFFVVRRFIYDRNTYTMPVAILPSVSLKKINTTQSQSASFQLFLSPENIFNN